MTVLDLYLLFFTDIALLKMADYIYIYIYNGTKFKKIIPGSSIFVTFLCPCVNFRLMIIHTVVSHS